MNNKDIYDDLHADTVSPRSKKVAIANDMVKFNIGTTPRAYKLVSDTDNIPSAQDFIKEDIDCPICKQKDNKTVNIKNPYPQKWVTKCPRCKTILNFFIPQPLQHIIESVNATVVNVISGYGLGKTTVDMYIVAKAIYNVDGASILVAGSTDTALNTGKDELRKFITNPSSGKGGDLVVMNNEVWKFKNGSSVRWMSANTNDVTKVRSWNFHLAVLLEASSQSYFKGGSHSFYNELKARMRDPLGNINMLDSNGSMVTITNQEGSRGSIEYDLTLNKIILESNPAPTAIMEEVFNKSSVLLLSERVANGDKLVKSFMNNYTSVNYESDIVTILAATTDNKVLPESYLKNNFGGMPPAYVARMRDCDLTRNESQVFPTARDHMISDVWDIDIKTADYIFQGFDPGSTDPSGVIYVAFWKGEQDGVTYKKPRIRVFNAKLTKGGVARQGNSFEDLSALFQKMETRFGLTKFDTKSGELVHGWTNPETKEWKTITRIADLQLWEKKRNRSAAEDQEEETEFDRWEALGYTFQKATKGVGSIQIGIDLVQEFFDNDWLEWWDELDDLNEEFIRYWYIEGTAGKLKPMENSWNHLMDALRYVCVAIKAIMNGESEKVAVLKPGRDPNMSMADFLSPQGRSKNIGGNQRSNRFKERGMKR